MGCATICKANITEDQKKILTAMAEMNKPCGSKDIVVATRIDVKAVGNYLKILKAKGYIGSPARCKYEITSEGKDAI